MQQSHQADSLEKLSKACCARSSAQMHQPQLDFCGQLELFAAQLGGTNTLVAQARSPVTEEVKEAAVDGIPLNFCAVSLESTQSL